jgi:hypothetical protein
MPNVKNIICPGCGKVESKEKLTFDYEILTRGIKELNRPKNIKTEIIHGLKWCEACA